jgi:hypothetical protein
LDVKSTETKTIVGEVPIASVAAEVGEPPAAPSAPSQSAVFLEPEEPSAAPSVPSASEEQTEVDVSGSATMDVESEASPTPTEVDEPVPYVPASNPNATINLAEILESSAAVSPPQGVGYLSDVELGLDKTRGVRHNLKHGWDGDMVDFLKVGNYDDAFFYLLSHYGVCELCYSTVEAHLVLTPYVQTHSFRKCSCGGTFMDLRKSHLDSVYHHNIGMPRVYMGECQDCGYFHTQEYVRKYKRTCCVCSPKELPTWPETDDICPSSEDQVRFAVVCLQSPDGVLRTLEDLNTNKLRRFAV